MNRHVLHATGPINLLTNNTPLNRKNRVRALTFIIFVSIILISQGFWDVTTVFSPDRVKEWLERFGGLAPLVFIFIMSLAVVISPIPSLPLDIAAGAFFGPLLGTVYSLTGALIGAAISFSVSRFLGRGFIERFLGGHINFCTYCSDRFLTKIVFFSRLLPFISFDIISYGAGLTKISFRNFLLSTLFGMIPLTFAYNYFGAVIVFGDVLTVIMGIILVILFFLVPRVLEKKGSLQWIKHQ